MSIARYLKATVVAQVTKERAPGSHWLPRVHEHIPTRKKDGWSVKFTYLNKIGLISQTHIYYSI